MPPESDTQLAVLCTKVEHLTDRLERLCDLIEPTKESPGLFGEVDRLKQTEASRKWWLGALSTVLAGDVGHRIWTFLKGP